MIEKSDWMNTKAHQSILDTYFVNSPILVSEDMSGAWAEDTRLTLGMRAGPTICPTNLIHEMCHLVEIDDARILISGWGLKTPEVYVPGRYSHMAQVPTTWQPIKREVRVIAMQWLLQNEFGIVRTKREALGAMEYMPDWCNVPNGFTEGYYDLEWEERCKITHNPDEHRFGILEAYMDECMAGKWTLAYFNDEWKRKTELLRQAQVSAA